MSSAKLHCFFFTLHDQQLSFEQHPPGSQWWWQGAKGKTAPVVEESREEAKKTQSWHNHQGHWVNEHTAGAITITTGGTSSSTPNRREEDLLHNCHYGLFQQQQKQQEGWAPIPSGREENIFCITVINSYLDVNCLSQPTGIIIALPIKTSAFLQANIVEFVPFYECFVKKKKKSTLVFYYYSKFLNSVICTLQC